MIMHTTFQITWPILLLIGQIHNVYHTLHMEREDFLIPLCNCEIHLSKPHHQYHIGDEIVVAGEASMFLYIVVTGQVSLEAKARGKTAFTTPSSPRIDKGHFMIIWMYALCAYNIYIISVYVKIWFLFLPVIIFIAFNELRRTLFGRNDEFQSHIRCIEHAHNRRQRWQHIAGFSFRWRIHLYVYVHISIYCEDVSLWIYVYIYINACVYILMALIWYHSNSMHPRGLLSVHHAPAVCGHISEPIPYDPREENKEIFLR